MRMREAGWPFWTAFGFVFLLTVHASPLEERGPARSFNVAPNLVLRTTPAADYSKDPPLIEGTAPLSVRFNLCNTEDSDAGDSLNWQFHFGDSRTPAFNGDGTFNADADHECRVDHVFSEGTFTVTLSATDKHLEDQSRGVTSLARSTTRVTVRAQRKEAPAAPAGATTGCGSGAPCLVFVTSINVPANFGATGRGGVLSGDDTCNGLAATAGRAGTYKAWLSDGAGNSPSTTFVQNPGPYVLVNGAMIANDWADLTTLGLIAPINIDETGATVVSPFENVWTGTRPNGTRATRFDGVGGFTPNGQCSGNWDQTGLLRRGSVGHTGSSGLGWSAGLIARNCLAANTNRLYCFQQQ